MAKNPAFQFYVYDWQTDRRLQLCSARARGVWIELMCLMHDGDPYGHLTVNGRKLDLKSVATLTHLSLKSVRSGIQELEKNGVIKVTTDGVYYCSRMVKDEQLRQVRREAGKLGGNPALLNLSDNQKDKQASKQKPTPSSPSSLSSSKDKKLFNLKGQKNRTKAVDCYNSDQEQDNPNSCSSTYQDRAVCKLCVKKVRA